MGERDEDFEAVWSLYPKKKGKQEAKPVIAAAIKAKGKDFLMDRVSAYASAVALWPEHDRQYVPDPVRWFKRGQYDDDPETWKRRGATPSLFSEQQLRAKAEGWA